MKTSSTAEPKKPEPRSILLIGPPGSRKTTLAMRFPGAYFLNCDQNLDGPEAHLRGAEKVDLTYMYDDVQRLDSGIMRPIEICYDYLMSLLDEARSNPKVKIPIIDSVTWVNEFILRKVLTQQKRDLMEGRDWNQFKSYFLNLLFGKLRSMGKTTICTVHECPVYTNDPKNMMAKVIERYDPTVQGSVGEFFGAFFTDVWRCEARPAAFGKTESWIVVDKTPKSPDLKNSFGFSEKEIKVNDNSDWLKLWKQLEGKV